MQFNYPPIIIFIFCFLIIFCFLLIIYNVINQKHKDEQALPDLNEYFGSRQGIIPKIQVSYFIDEDRWNTIIQNFEKEYYRKYKVEEVEISQESGNQINASINSGVNFGSSNSNGATYRGRPVSIPKDIVLDFELKQLVKAKEVLFILEKHYVKDSNPDGLDFFVNTAEKLGFSITEEVLEKAKQIIKNSNFNFEDNLIPLLDKYDKNLFIGGDFVITRVENSTAYVLEYKIEKSQLVNNHLKIVSKIDKGTLISAFENIVNTERVQKMYMLGQVQTVFSKNSSSNSELILLPTIVYS